METLKTATRAELLALIAGEKKTKTGGDAPPESRLVPRGHSARTFKSAGRNRGAPEPRRRRRGSRSRPRRGRASARGGRVLARLGVGVGVGLGIRVRLGRGRGGTVDSPRDRIAGVRRGVGRVVAGDHDSGRVAAQRGDYPGPRSRSLTRRAPRRTTRPPRGPRAANRAATATTRRPRPCTTRGADTGVPCRSPGGRQQEAQSKSSAGTKRPAPAPPPFTAGKQRRTKQPPTRAPCAA